MVAGGLLLLQMITRSALGQPQYIVKGTVTDRFYNPPSQDAQETNQYRFEVFVTGKHWRIDLYQMKLTNNITRRTVGSENGNEVVHLAVNNRGPSFVLVEPEPYPVGNNVPAFVHLWLMYASGSFFANGIKDEEPPIYKYAYCNMRPELDLPNEQVAVLLNEQEPKLPRYIAFYDGKLPNVSLQKQLGTSPQMPDDFYTNAIYEASDFNTVGKLQLPSKFDFRYFLPKTDGRNLDGKSVWYSCEAEVDSIDDECPKELAAIALPAHYVSQDLRVKVVATSNSVARLHGMSRTNSSFSFTYNGTDFSNVPTLAELNKFMAMRGHMRREDKHTGAVRIALAISTILPLAVLLVRTLRPKKNPTGEDVSKPERPSQTNG